MGVVPCDHEGEDPCGHEGEDPERSQDHHEEVLWVERVGVVHPASQGAGQEEEDSPRMVDAVEDRPFGPPREGEVGVGVGLVAMAVGLRNAKVEVPASALPVAMVVD